MGLLYLGADRLVLGVDTISLGGPDGIDATAPGATLTYTLSLIAGAATASSQASGVTLTETYSLIPGAASGGGAVDATANGATLTYSTALIAGSASASSQAAGATLSIGYSLIAGAAQAASQAAGQTLTETYALLPGAASGNQNATAPGATLSYAYSLLAGIATGDVASVTTRRGDDGGFGQRERFWAKKAEDWIEAHLEKLPKIAKKPKRKRAEIIEAFRDEADDLIADFPAYQPRIDLLSGLLEQLSQPVTDYAALAEEIARQMAMIEAQKRARRRARDIEAILLLDA